MNKSTTKTTQQSKHPRQPVLTSLLRDLRANRITGTDFCLYHSKRMDTYLQKLCKATINKTTLNTIAIVATGGYGRAELCPYSDIDLLILIPNKTSQKDLKQIHEQVEKLLYALWDTNLKIGHAVRTIKECITISNDDSKVFSSLLDTRFIHGQEELFNEFLQTWQKNLKPRTQKSFVKSKLDERDARHQKLGDSRYVLEPNIKEGKGSLRDYQTLFWIAKTVYNANTPKELAALKIITRKERKRFEKDYDFLLTIRCHLHDIAGRAEERLHFDIQPQLALRLGYKQRDNARAVERFMKHYFLVTKDIGDLTRILIASIEDNQDEQSRLTPSNKRSFLGFITSHKRLNFTEDQKLKNHPVDILRFFRVAQEADLDIHPRALQKIRRNIKLIDRELRNNTLANQIFMEILTDTKNASLTLRRMNEAGVLERFIPEFQKIKGLMQFDRYHIYTVDEHTLNAIDIMHKIENGELKDKAPLASQLIHTIENRRVLYVATLLHDICKGREQRGNKGNQRQDLSHSQLGAELALQLCPRLGLSDQGTRLVSWLVFEHLFMSETAFKRNPDDQQTIDDFLFRVHDLERLNLLTILTTCDIMAVGPGRWTGWQDTLIKELYNRSKQTLLGKQSIAATHKPLPDEILNKLETEQAIIAITQDETKQSTNIDIVTPDKLGLFATLSGALSLSGANIIEARIHTHDNGIAEDSFTVQNSAGKPILRKFQHTKIQQTIIDALNNPNHIETKITELQKTTKPSTKELVFDIPFGVIIDNTVSQNSTYIETYGRDKPALLYRVAQCITEHGLIITHAKIHTHGLKTTDIFYVTDKSGEKVTSQRTLSTLQNKLRHILEKE